ncbi:kinase domain protein (macronuclear) [Tetrahymena thermophila SB210]|uniref:Kinase domain protein n=1 Tax=Tetrahymena thermophila (strain SB210) TaxID=312017 RepID=Q23AV3_TETTS|nr:kinase domain protein [Tetrahymena thermophila SB210]EAR93731.2 kinase domain protein [Tetrahymena thermophila SB210]|eukprot:XP_001013976.2 kinase domain protein [Tetrahymena thermophila SB210]
MIQIQDKVLQFKGQQYKGTISCTGIQELICQFGSANDFYGDFGEFVNVFKDLNEVQILQINFWNCGLNTFESMLPQFLNMFPNLKNLKLSVWSCSLEDEGLRIVSEALQNLKALTQLFLDFRWNKIKDKGFISFSQALGQLTQLQSLQIDGSNNLVTHKGMQEFATGLAKLQELKNFDLFFESNEMQSIGIKYLSEGVKQCKKLTDISLNFRNNIIKDNETLRKACQALSMCSQLINSKFDFLIKRRRYYYNQNQQPKGKEGLYKNELFKLQRTVLLDIDTTNNENDY